MAILTSGLPSYYEAMISENKLCIMYLEYPRREANPLIRPDFAFPKGGLIRGGPPYLCSLFSLHMICSNADHVTSCTYYLNLNKLYSMCIANLDAKMSTTKRTLYTIQYLFQQSEFNILASLFLTIIFDRYPSETSWQHYCVQSHFSKEFRVPSEY